PGWVHRPVLQWVEPGVLGCCCHSACFLAQPPYSAAWNSRLLLRCKFPSESDTRRLQCCHRKLFLSAVDLCCSTVFGVAVRTLATRRISGTRLGTQDQPAVGGLESQAARTGLLEERVFRQHQPCTRHASDAEPR